MRRSTATAMLSAALLLSSCTSDGGGTASPDDPAGTSSATGCGECVAELADVRTRIEQLPDVRELVTLETYTASPTNGAGVQVELRTRSTGDATVIDEIGRIIWQSRIAPVDEVFVTAEDASGELVRGSSPFDFTATGRQYDTFVEQWGERPVSG